MKLAHYCSKILNDLAAFQEMQGNRQEALPLSQRVSVIREQVLEPEHPKTRATQLRLTTLKQLVSQEAVAPSHNDTSPEQSEQNN